MHGIFRNNGVNYGFRIQLPGRRNLPYNTTVGKMQKTSLNTQSGISMHFRLFLYPFHSGGSNLNGPKRARVWGCSSNKHELVSNYVQIYHACERAMALVEPAFQHIWSTFPSAIERKFSRMNEETIWNRHFYSHTVHVRITICKTNTTTTNTTRP